MTKEQHKVSLEEKEEEQGKSQRRPEMNFRSFTTMKLSNFLERQNAHDHEADAPRPHDPVLYSAKSNDHFVRRPTSNAAASSRPPDQSNQKQSLKLLTHHLSIVSVSP